MKLANNRRFIQSQVRRIPCRGPGRSGTTMVECMVAAMLLVTVISFVASLTFRIGLVWKDTAHHRVAVNELSNQLERLTLLPPEEVMAALEELRPTQLASRTLSEPKLTGQWIEDEWGGRVVLRLNWRRQHEGKPVEMVGWLATIDDQPGVGTAVIAPDDEAAQSTPSANPLPSSASAQPEEVRE